jgi:hypothetical protein
MQKVVGSNPISRLPILEPVSGESDKRIVGSKWLDAQSMRNLRYAARDSALHCACQNCVHDQG